MSFFGRVFGTGSSSTAPNSVPPQQVPPPQPQPPAHRPPFQPIQFQPNYPPQPFMFGPAPPMPAAAQRPPSPTPPPAVWELIGDEASAALMSPMNPFRDPNEPPSAQPCARTYFTMNEYNNRVWVFGGFGDAKGRFNDLRAFDVDRNQWELVEGRGDAPKPMYLHSAVVYKDALWVFGGSIGKDSNDLYSFHFLTREWARIQPNPMNQLLPCARYGHAACVLGDNMIIAGGCKQTNQYFMDSYCYHFPTNTWRRIADIPIDIAYHSLVPYQERVLLVGGYNGVKFNPNIYRYAVQEAQPFQPPPQWTLLPVTVKPTSSLSSAGTRQPPAFCGAAVSVVNDHLFTFGGYTASGHASDLYKLNLRTNEWSVVDLASGSRPVARAYLQSVITRDGHLIIFGGYDGSKCVSDFRRIAVAQPEVNILHMLKEMGPRTTASYAMRTFAKHHQPLGAGLAVPVLKPTLDEIQLEALLNNLKHHLISDQSRLQQEGKPNFGGSSSSSSSSSSQLSSNSAAFYPFDTSRLSDMIEFGFTKEFCLECLEWMHQKKMDTKNFNLVVENLLTFQSEKDKNKPTTTSGPPIPEPRPASLSVSASSFKPVSPPIPPRSNSLSLLTLSPASSPMPSTPATGQAVLPPSSNNASLQEQVNRLTAEVSEMRTCKVCFEATIDCVLMPCGHLVVCQSCAADMKERKLECPAARCNINSFIKVFWS